ncbi:hypothetical protein CR513_22580, partial [Mucuna pruriens]
MDDHESIDQIYGQFQTIFNNQKSLGKTYDNCDHITKILQVTTLKVSKDLKKLPMEKLLGKLKVNEMELNEDKG